MGEAHFETFRGKGDLEKSRNGIHRRIATRNTRNGVYRR